MNKILFSIAMLVSSYAFPQGSLEDVIYLKTGSVIRGKIQTADLPKNWDGSQGGNKASESIKIELTGGSVFVFQKNEIDSIKTENGLKHKLKEIKQNYFRRDRGYRNMTEFGIIYGANLKKDNNTPINNYNNTPEDDFGLSLHTVNGYQVWPYLFAGAGMGIDRLISYQQTFSPFYLRVASEFLKKKVTPYVFCDVGYSYMWKKKNDDYKSYKNKGGLYVSCGGGVRIYSRSRASVILSLAYKRNNNETTWWYTQTTDGTYYDIKRTYQRLVMSVGVTF